MTKDELIEFLKENLTIAADFREGRAYYDTSSLEVSLKLGEETISTHTIWMPDWEPRRNNDW